MKWNPIPFDSNGVYHEECRPDTLYSWVTSRDLIDGDHADWPIRRGTGWFFRTPLGSFLYGSYSFRIKLKPDVQFVIVNGSNSPEFCARSKKEAEHTVYMRYLNNPSDHHYGFSEYALCSNGPIESWSFGMETHLEEMKRERDLVSRLGYQDGLLRPQPGCKDCFLGYTIIDTRNSPGKSTIDTNISLMKKLVEEKTGKVWVMNENKSYTAGPKVKAHFSTRLPLPFHHAFAKEKLSTKTSYESILIVSAEANQKEITKLASDHCGDKPDCSYQISTRFIPVTGKIDDFKITWKCCDSLTHNCAAHQYALLAHADQLEGVSFQIACKADGSASWKSKSAEMFQFKAD